MKLFLDLDGVLADFDRGVQELTGKRPHELEVKEMWRRLSRAPEPGFYASLEFMSDALELWEFSKPHNPTILTGIPFGNWAPGQKKVWCGTKLGWDIPVITCWARDKHLHGGADCVLVDDREKARAAWEGAGGTFILHTSAANSIAELKKLGFK